MNFPESLFRRDAETNARDGRAPQNPCSCRWVAIAIDTTLMATELMKTFQKTLSERLSSACKKPRSRTLIVTFVRVSGGGAENGRRGACAPQNQAHGV